MAIASFKDFLIWERTSRDTIDLKKTYIDVAGDLIAGLLLSQIIYWHLPDKNGDTKLKVYKKGKYWLAKQRTDWWKEIRITPKQYDRAISKLRKLEIVETWNTMFDAKNTPHIYLNQNVLMELMNKQMDIQTKKTSRFSPLGKNDIHQIDITLTETTTKNTNKVNKGISKRNTVRAFSLDKYISSLKGDVDKDKYSAISYYLEEYERYFGNKHPNLKANQWDRVMEKILSFSGEHNTTYELTLEHIKMAIDKHFLTEYENCDYNILHFVEGDIIRNRIYEECYRED